MKYPCWLVAACSLTLVGSIASAQYPGGPFAPGMQPIYKPPISPYLNLLRPGFSPAGNYATLVQPQLQVNQGIQGLQKQYATAQQAITTLEQQGPQGPPQLPATGHATGFMTHKVYFMNLAGAGAGGPVGTGTGLGIGGTGAGGGVPGATGLNTGAMPKKK